MTTTGAMTDTIVNVGQKPTRKFTVVIRGTADGAMTKRRIVREVRDSVILAPDGVVVLEFEEPEVIVRRP